jgi:hypothetical protein
MAIYKFSNVGGFGTYQRYNNFLAGNPVFAAGDFESIATVTLSGNQSTVSFTSIPSTYQHLQIRLMVRASIADSADHNIVAAFNSDTTHTNYRTHVIDGNGATASAGEAQVSGFYAGAGLTLGNSSTASSFSASVVDILDYGNTNKNTTVRTLNGFDSNGAGYARFGSSVWLNTAAITSIDISLRTGTSFVQHSSFALYGIKG